MRQPTGHAWDGKQHGKHLDGEAECLIDEPRIKVDVRIQLARHEVIVFQRSFFELECNVKQWVLARYFKDVVSRFLDDRGARVIVFVHPMAKAHEAAFAGFYIGNERRHVIDGADALQHVNDCFVGPAMQWAIERRCCGCCCTVWVGMG